MKRGLRLDNCVAGSSYRCLEGRLVRVGLEVEVGVESQVVGQGGLGELSKFAGWDFGQNAWLVVAEEARELGVRA